MPYIGHVDNINSGQSWTSPWILSDFFSGVTGSVNSDQPVTVFVEQSGDGTNVDLSTSTAVSANTGTLLKSDLQLAFFRIRVANAGGSNTTSFRLNTHFTRGENP